jgi:hypothetical protein
LLALKSFKLIKLSSISLFLSFSFFLSFSQVGLTR